MRTIRAVELNFIIIGEAVEAVPEEIQEKYPEVPWQLMREMRNQLVHAYFSMSPEILWNTIHQDLPQLVKVLKQIRQNPE